MEFRCDSFPIPKYEERPDGYLSLFLPIAREGELKYRNADGSERVEFVSAQTLKKSAHTFTNQPITLGHPLGRVLPSNVKDYAVGMTGRLVQLDAKGILWVDGTVTDAMAIQSIKSGKTRQLSCGYDAEVEPRTDGRFEQIDRVGNHTALVDRARGGEDLTIRIDGVDVPHADCDCELEVPESLVPSATRKSSKQRKDRKPMTQILIGKKLMRLDAEDPTTLDAIQTEVQAIVDRAEKAESDLDGVQVRLDAATATADSLTKERDGLQARIDAAEPATSTTRTDAADTTTDLKARIAVIREVSPFLAKHLTGFNEDSLYELTPQEIKTAYLVVKRPDLKERLDSASADYVEAFYDAQKPDAGSTSESGSRVDGILSRLGGEGATTTNQDGMPAALSEAKKKRAEKIRANGPMSAFSK